MSEVSGPRSPKVPFFDPWTDLEWEEHVEARDIVKANPDGMTLEEIGAHLGITRERVRQIEASALMKLREAEGGDSVEADGIQVAVMICEECADYFVRRGRISRCPRCAPHLHGIEVEDPEDLLDLFPEEEPWEKTKTTKKPREVSIFTAFGKMKS